MPRKSKLLIIDDEKDFCHFIKFNLENTRKYKVYTATSGSDGIKTALRKKPDLVLLDINMPLMNGFEVLKALKGNLATTSIPVLVLSAVDSNGAQIKASENFCDDYLVKPVGLEQLVDKIDQLLSKTCLLFSPI